MSSESSRPTPGSDTLVAEHRVEEFLSLDETGALLARLVSSFRSSAGECAGALRSAVLERDLEAVREISHMLRGSALNLGGLELADQCAGLEERAQAGAWPSIAEVEQLERCLQRTLAELQQRVRSSQE